MADGAFDTIKTNWALISQAPWAFGAVTLIIIVVVSFVVNRLKAEQIASLEGRLKLRDDEIADYKRKLSGATPDEAKNRIEVLEREVASLRPRVLSNDQIDAIANEAQIAPGNVSIIYDMAYPDGPRIAQQLISAFKRAGWGASNGIVGGPGHMPDEGLTVHLHSIAERTASEHALIKALRAADLPFSEMSKTSQDTAAKIIEVVVTRPSDR